MLEKSLESMSLAVESQSIAAEREHQRLRKEIKDAFDEAHNPKYRSALMKTMAYHL